ncbi:hypothetical protein [Mycobacterium sp.]|uniref:hypothetical protein n=1 Tax=Mycobacterium sp. TaxID=1785 RepID=UPI0025F8C80A|nr:hypothetical protein [Mycobacterium sp.]
MIITGALLAEQALATESGLHLWNGVISGALVGPDRISRLFLVVLTQAETDNSDRTVEIEMRPPTGEEPRVHRFDVPVETANSEIGFAYWPFEFHLPFDGRWILMVSAGGASAVALPLQVASAT